MSCCRSDIKELLSVYLDGACSAVEKQAVEQHLNQCVSCRQELEELKSLSFALKQMPDLPLPIGFEAAWQKRLQEECSGQVISLDLPEDLSAQRENHQTKSRRKPWFASGRLIGVAATVLLCFSISVIGGHINTGYEHFVSSGLQNQIVSDEQAYAEKSAEQKMTAVADTAQYGKSVFPGLGYSARMRNNENDIASSSRDGRVIEHYLLSAANIPEIASAEGENNQVAVASGEEAPVPYQMENLGKEKEIDGDSSVQKADGTDNPGEENVLLDGIDVAEGVNSIAPANGEEGAAGAEEPEVKLESNAEKLSERNTQLNTKAERQITAAKDASSREVYNGYLALITEDVANAKEQVISIVARYHGYVDGETVLGEENDNPNIRLEICVEKDHLQSAMTDISGLGKVTAKSIDRVDLSEEYYDAQGRLTRQRALEQSLLRLIAEAEDVETLRAMEKELEKVTIEIESIIAKLEQISSQRKYSTIVVSIAVDPVAIQGSATLGDKFQRGFSSFITFCKDFPDNLLVGFGFMFQILAVLIILLILFYLVMHKLLRKPSSANSSQK